MRETAWSVHVSIFLCVSSIFNLIYHNDLVRESVLDVWHDKSFRAEQISSIFLKLIVLSWLPFLRLILLIKLSRSLYHTKRDCSKTLLKSDLRTELMNEEQSWCCFTSVTTEKLIIIRSPRYWERLNVDRQPVYVPIININESKVP